MKKLITFVLTLGCVLGLVGCNAEGNEVVEDFVGIITSIGNNSTSYIVKVTDSGSSNLKIGDRVIVPMNNEENTGYSVDDYIKIEFNGVVTELTAVSIANKGISAVFSVEKIENGIE